MARRTKAEADETRTKLLDAAERVFFEKGVARASLNEIAQRAGATRGAVYWHFKDKVDVFSSMLARICMPFEEICDDRYGDLAPLDRIRRSIYAVFDSMDGDERRRKVFDTALFKLEYVGELESVRAGHVESFACSQRKFAADLADAAAQRGIDMPMTPEEAALGLHSLFVGLIHGWVLNEGNFPLRRMGEMSVEVYLSGLGFGSCSKD
jgi:TetR/AcrR family acrAB operon transcriptional repressor